MINTIEKNTFCICGSTYRTVQSKVKAQEAGSCLIPHLGRQILIYTPNLLISDSELSSSTINLVGRESELHWIQKHINEVLNIESTSAIFLIEVNNIFMSF